MTDVPRPPSSVTAGPEPSRGKGREDRLKAALKANMARRKAQARAKALQDDDGTGPGDRQDDTEGSGPTDRQQQDNE